LFAGAQPIPALVETPFVAAKGWARRFSIAALTIAALTLFVRSLKNLNSPFDGKGFKGERLPIIPIMMHPSFIRALRLMARIATGNYGDREIQDPLVRRQLADLRLLEAQGGRLADLKADSAEIPRSLRYTLTHLIWLKNFLEKIPLLNAFLKFRGIQLDTLDPELLMLVNEFLSMEGVAWYFAKQTYMLKQIEARRAVMDPTLWNMLMLSPQDLQAAQQAARKGQPEEIIRDLHFARRFQKQIALMDKDSSPRLVRGLLTILMGQLSRKDVSDSYVDSILQIISLVDPDNGLAVQMTAVRDGQVKTLFMNLPLILKNSPVHLEMFMRNFPLLYDEKGRPIVAPELNHIYSAEQAA
jgi:hypothetical protein